jgi:GWxTD domain-containing protein
MDERGNVVFESYLIEGTDYSLVSAEADTNDFIVSYYSVLFPAGAPVFSEAMAPVTSTVRVDSTLFIKPGSKFTFPKTGNYLIQKDTNGVKGFAYTVYDDYPKYAYLENLVGPLVYVCTKNEFDKLKNARGEKKAFDRVILSITGDTERARIFMRSYFKRVELANQFFSSFKEGWKTDRGMVYIIYGIPDEVYKFKDREVWKYKSSTYKASFDFVRSGTLFDPDNYVLIRDNKFKETWYEVVDLWRNARF